MNIKRILAGSLAAVMAGATIAMGGMALDLSGLGNPDLAGATPVLGATASTADVIGALNIVASAQHGVAVAAGVPSTVTTSVPTLPNAINLGRSTSNPLRMGSTLDTEVSSVGDSVDWLKTPNQLTDDNGATYDYSLNLGIGGTPTVTYDDSSQDTVFSASIPNIEKNGDPDVIIDTGTSSANPFLTLNIIFDDAVELNDTVVEGNSLNILGSKYTILPETTGSSVVLSGGGESHTGNIGESFTYTDASGAASGDTWTVEIEIIGSSSARFSVSKNGGSPVSESINTGVLETVNGLSIFLNSVDTSSKESVSDIAEFELGGRKIKLDDGSTVKLNTNEDVVSNTLVTFTKTNANFDKIAIAWGGKDSDNDQIQVGQTVADPVFGKINTYFQSYEPSKSGASAAGLAGSYVAALKVGGDREAQLTTEKLSSFGYVYDSDKSNTGTDLKLQNDNSENIVTLEGAAVQEDDFVVIATGDQLYKNPKYPKGAVYKLEDISSLGTSDAKITLTPYNLDGTSAATGSSITLNLGSNNLGTGYWAYTIYAYCTASGGTDQYGTSLSAESCSFTWGTSAQESSTLATALGSERTVFPVFPALGAATAKGAFVDAVSGPTLDDLTVGTILVLPTGKVNVTAVNSGAPGNITLQEIDPSTGTVTLIGNGTESTIAVGALNYNFTSSATDADDITVEVTGASGQPSVLFVEEKSTDNDYQTILFAASENSDGLTITSPVFTDGVGSMVTWNSDSDVSSTYDQFGTYVEFDSGDQGDGYVSYSNQEARANIFIGGSDLASAAGALTHTTVGTPGQAVLDTEAESKKNGNLIVVGGPAINTLTAELADKSCVSSLDDWRADADGDGTADKAGTAEISLVNDAFTTGKWTLVVAGHSADDTRAASTYLANNADSLAAGTYTQGGTSVTVAQC